MNKNIAPPSQSRIRQALCGTKNEPAIHPREFYEALRRFTRFIQRAPEPDLVRRARRSELALTRLLRRMKKVKA